MIDALALAVVGAALGQSWGSASSKPWQSGSDNIQTWDPGDESTWPEWAWTWRGLDEDWGILEEPDPHEKVSDWWAYPGPGTGAISALDNEYRWVMYGLWMNAHASYATARASRDQLGLSQWALYYQFLQTAHIAEQSTTLSSIMTSNSQHTLYLLQIAGDVDDIADDLPAAIDALTELADAMGPLVDELTAETADPSPDPLVLPDIPDAPDITMAGPDDLIDERFDPHEQDHYESLGADVRGTVRSSLPAARTWATGLSALTHGSLPSFNAIMPAFNFGEATGQVLGVTWSVPVEWIPWQATISIIVGFSIALWSLGFVWRFIRK